MKKQISLLLGIFISSPILFAQNNWCGTDAYNQAKYESLTPEQKHVYDTHDERIQMRIEQMNHSDSRTTPEETFVIPTVVHVFHDNDIGNITMAQVEDGLRMVNEDYRRLNADTNETRDIFMPFVGKAKFEFRLAKLDPNGDATDGVVRINSTDTYDAGDNVKFVSGWPTDQYFNVWLVETIDGSTQTSTILGYAEFPNSGLGQTYGVVVRNDAWGRFGTANGGRTATHEMGHCFGLYHTFQSGCGSDCNSSGDRVCDTPPSFQSTQGCNTTQNTCSNDATGSSDITTDMVDQIENYMSYDECQNMFSQGQIDRMVAVMNDYTRLQNLISIENQAATGVDQLCKADFSSDARILCGGGNVSFKDWSIYGQNDWDWTFEGGTPSTSNEEFPYIAYNESGLFDVSLDVSNGFVSQNESKSGYILVSDPIDNYPPLQESFEDITSVPSERWYPVNNGNPIFSFKLKNGVGATGNQCIIMENIYNEPGDVDELISGAIDLSPMSDVDISFKTAYAEKLNTTTNDKLAAYYSTNCGETWILCFFMSGSTLASAPPKATGYVPSDASEWIERSTFSIGSNALQDNFMLKFVFTSDGGNNLYIDDINISGTFDTKPELHLPISGTTGLPEDMSINWKSIEGVDSYTYQLDTTSLFNSSLLEEGFKTYIDATPNNTDTEKELTGLVHGMKYYWRVKSTTNGTVSDWSDTWSFTVAQNGVGFEELNAHRSLMIYPNPSNGKVWVMTTKTTSIQVYSTLGQLVETINPNNGIVQIDASNWQKGIYIVQQGETTSKLIIK